MGTREPTFRAAVAPSNLLLNKLVASNVYGKLTTNNLIRENDNFKGNISGVIRHHFVLINSFIKKCIPFQYTYKDLNTSVPFNNILNCNNVFNSGFVKQEAVGFLSVNVM